MAPKELEWSTQVMWTTSWYCFHTFCHSGARQYLSSLKFLISNRVWTKFFSITQYLDTFGNVKPSDKSCTNGVGPFLL